jgi:hypothetical protein
MSDIPRQRQKSGRRFMSAMGSDAFAWSSVNGCYLRILAIASRSLRDGIRA